LRSLDLEGLAQRRGRQRRDVPGRATRSHRRVSYSSSPVASQNSSKFCGHTSDIR
jgi:hypothetical protein